MDDQRITSSVSLSFCTKHEVEEVSLGCRNAFWHFIEQTNRSGKSMNDSFICNKISPRCCSSASWLSINYKYLLLKCHSFAAAEITESFFFLSMEEFLRETPTLLTLMQISQAAKRASKLSCCLAAYWRDLLTCLGRRANHSCIQTRVTTKKHPAEYLEVAGGRAELIFLVCWKDVQTDNGKIKTDIYYLLPT